MAGRETIEWLSGGIELPEQPRVRRPKRLRLLVAGAVALTGVVVAAVLARPDHHNTTYPSPGPQAIGGPPTAPVAVDGGSDAPSDTFRATLGQRPQPVSLLAPRDTSGLISMPWELVNVTDGGRTLDIVYAAGDGTCYTKKGVEVLETAKTVEVLALSAYRQPPATACMTGLDLGYAAVPLAHALANRTVLHAPVHGGWVNALRGL